MDSEMIISIDWAIKKPLYYYDGNEVKTTYNPEEIKADIVLIETGAPYNIIAQLDGEIYQVDGKETKKYAELYNIEQTDENDAKIIYVLYKEKPELFKKIEQRNKLENELKFDIKMYYVTMKSVYMLNNRNKALQKEYIMSVFDNEISKLEEMKERYKNRIMDLSLFLYPENVMALKNMKEFGEFNASVFGSLIDVRNFKNYRNVRNKKQSGYVKFKKFCGYGFISEKKEHMNYNRILKNVLWTSVDSTVVKHRLEPYRSLYDTYKQKKLNEGKTKGRADMLARRKVCQIVLKKIWKVLKRRSEDNSSINNIYENIPRQEIGVKIKNKIDEKQGILKDWLI